MIQDSETMEQTAPAGLAKPATVYRPGGSVSVPLATADVVGTVNGGAAVVVKLLTVVVRLPPGPVLTMVLATVVTLPDAVVVPPVFPQVDAFFLVLVTMRLTASIRTEQIISRKVETYQQRDRVEREHSSLGTTRSGQQR